jgi:pimeloyl-ACP methyl ester carboxylesterase
MSDLGILFLPSGPGLSSGPAREFLESRLSKHGKVVFWDEPSEKRGERLADSSKEAFQQVVDSLARAARGLPEHFVILTESFGSIVAEVFYDRVVDGGLLRPGQRLIGILHTPPVLDLEASLRFIVDLGADDLERQGSSEAAKRLREGLSKNPTIESPEFGQALDLAFTSPELLPRYFATGESFARWAKGFTQPEFQPDPETRTRVLRAFTAEGRTRTTFSPNVPTWVFGGIRDPYRAVKDFEPAIESARRSGSRTEALEWVSFEHSHHYPFIDEPKLWDESLARFLRSCEAFASRAN